MMIEEKNEFLHSWYVLIITIFTLLFLLLNQKVILNFILMSGVLSIFIKNGLKIRKIKSYFLYAFFFSFGIFILNVLYPAKDLRTGEVYQLLNMRFYEVSVLKAFMTMIKLFCISFLSMSSGAIIDYTKVILYLIVHKGLKVFWGYPILLAINSIALFKEEFERIKINARLRNLPVPDRVSIFFPLLVFAIRHSQRGALSLVTRGLNQQKTFYFSYGVYPEDRQKLFLFWIIYFGLVTLSFLKLR